MTQLSMLEQIRAAAALAASTAENMTEAVAGGGQAQRLLPEGYCDMRLVQLVEYGTQPQTMNGKPVEPAPEFQLAFACYGEGVENEDGSPYIIRPFAMKRSRNEKANSFLLFKALNWKNQATCFAQLVGEKFMGKIFTHQPKPDAVAKGAKPTSQIDLKAFLPPIDLRSKKEYDIKMPEDKYFKLFLWDHPTVEAWDSLFIEGTDDKGKSKNYVQNKLLSALDFAGSALEQMLVSKGLPFVVPPKAAAAVNPAGAPTGPVAGNMAMPDLGADMMEPEPPADVVHRAAAAAPDAAPAPKDPPFDVDPAMPELP